MRKLHRRQFENIAKAIKVLKFYRVPFEEDNVIEYLQESNPVFDPDRFRRAIK